MLYLTCTTVTSVDLVHYGVYRVKDWVSVNCGTSNNIAYGQDAMWIIFEDYICFECIAA